MKQKTHSGAKKRVRITTTGKVQMNRSNKRHLLLQKSKQSKRAGLKEITLTNGMAKKMKKLLPGTKTKA